VTGMIPTARNVFTAHPLAGIFHPPHPPIASYSISRDGHFPGQGPSSFPLLAQGSVRLFFTGTTTVLSCASCAQKGGSGYSPSCFSQGARCASTGIVLFTPASFFSLLLVPSGIPMQI